MGNIFTDVIDAGMSVGNALFNKPKPKPQPIQEWEDRMSGKTTTTNQFQSLRTPAFALPGSGNTPLEKKVTGAVTAVKEQGPVNAVKNLFADVAEKTDINFKLPPEIKEPDPWFQALPEKEKTAFVRVYGDRAIYKDQLDALYKKETETRKASLTPKALPQDYKEPGLWGQAVEEVKKSTVETVQSLAATLEKEGIKYNIKSLEDFGANTADKLQQVILDNPEWQPPADMKKWSDPRFYVRGIVNFIPSMAVSIAAAAAGTMVAGPVGGAVAGFASSSALEGGSSFKEGQEAGVPLSANISATDKIGLINGALEYLPIGRLLNKTGPGKELKDRLVKRIVTEFVNQGLEEGSTEAMQQVVSNTMMKDYIENRSTWDGVLESFVFGAASGAGMGAAGQIVTAPEVAQGIKEVSQDTRGSVPFMFGLYGNEEQIAKVRADMKNDGMSDVAIDQAIKEMTDIRNDSNEAKDGLPLLEDAYTGVEKRTGNLRGPEQGPSEKRMGGFNESESLINEAKKYDSAEEFGAAILKDLGETSFRGAKEDLSLKDYRIETRPIDDFAKWEARTPGDQKRIDTIKAAIQEGKMFLPVIGSEGAEKIQVFDGHNRIAAYQELGINSVPVLIEQKGEGTGKILGLDEIYNKAKGIGRDTTESLRKAFEDATGAIPNDVAEQIRKASKRNPYAEERMTEEYLKTGQLPKEAKSQTDLILEDQADRKIKSEAYQSEVGNFTTDTIKLFDQVRRMKETKFAEGDFETMRKDEVWGPKVEQALEKYRTGEGDVIDDVEAFQSIMDLPSLKEIRLADRNLTLKERKAMRSEENTSLKKRLETMDKTLKNKETRDATADEIRGAIIDYAKTILPMKERGPLLAWVKNAKNMKDFEKAMAKIDQLADQYEQNLQADDYIQQRVKEVKSVRDFLGLTDEDMNKISRRDIRYMDAKEYADFMDQLRIKAVEFAQTKQAKIELMDLIHRRDYKNWQNLQKAMGLPTVDNMTTQQLEQFLEALKPYQYGDVFMSVRKLETVDRTDLKGIKTIREARERLSAEIGVELKDLEQIKFEDLDRLRFDTALAEKDPFHKMMVDETNKAVLKADLSFLEDKEGFQKLYKKAVDSRKKTLSEKVTQMLIPQQKQLVQYLEASPEQKKTLGGQLTTAEIDLAHYMMEHYKAVMDYHAAIEAEFGTRFGNDDYYTHVKRGILESIKEDGIIKAFKNVFESYRQDADVFNILDERTAMILPMEKFFQYSLRRSDQMGPSYNVAKSFLSYMKTFRKKQMFDSIIPKLEIYAHSMEKQMTTPRGLEMDKAATNFVREWINNKKGRRTKLLAKQGSTLDLTLRTLKTFVSVMDLGFSIPLGIATQVGEQVTTYETIGAKAYAVGQARQLTKQGKSIIEKYENFIGESPWKELIAPGKGGGERLLEGMFVFFRDAGVRANKTLLLGSMTKAEFEAGEISLERMSELKQLMGRWRDVEGSHSIIGATPEAGIAKQYLSWAIPIARTLGQDSMALLRTVTRLGDSGKRLNRQQSMELLRLVQVGAMIAMAGMFNVDDEDKSFLGELKKKAYRELSTIFQAVTPTTWVRIPRTMQFLVDLTKNLGEIVTLETYKSGENEGNLKGVQHLKQQFTPKMIKQFMGVVSPDEPASSKTASGGFDFSADSFDFSGDSFDFGGGKGGGFDFSGDSFTF